MDKNCWKASKVERMTSFILLQCADFENDGVTFLFYNLCVYLLLFREQGKQQYNLIYHFSKCVFRITALLFPVIPIV